MLKSLIIAFSTYSRIPMPRIQWEEKAMKYSMCFFPAVGLVTGLCSVGCLYGLKALGMGKLFVAAALTVLPILLNGGIHMDGFLDTVDAKRSYKSREEKLQILKDPHTGAFAIIYGIVYLVLMLGLFSEVSEKEIVFVAAGYVYSRILSGLSVVTLRKAKKDGMVAAAADAAQKNCKWILTAELAVCAAGLLCLDWVRGLVCLLTGLVCFLYYRRMAYRTFGGITGDLAGYFLQVCELMILFGMVFLSRLWELLPALQAAL